MIPGGGNVVLYLEMNAVRLLPAGAGVNVAVQVVPEPLSASRVPFWLKISM